MNEIRSICRNNDFRRIYRRGKQFLTPVVVIYILKNRTNNVRIGITTSKKIGNAVKRNRSRRIIREAFRTMQDQVKCGYDIVFVARGKTPYLKSTDIQKHLVKQLKYAGVLHRNDKLL